MAELGGASVARFGKARRRLFKERLIYEQSASRGVREVLEKRTSHGSCQPLKIERLHCRTYLAGLRLSPRLVYRPSAAPIRKRG